MSGRENIRLGKCPVAEVCVRKMYGRDTNQSWKYPSEKFQLLFFPLRILSRGTVRLSNSPDNIFFQVELISQSLLRKLIEINVSHITLAFTIMWNKLKNVDITVNSTGCLDYKIT